MSDKQSKRLGRFNLTQMDDGTLCIHFPDDNKMILARFIIQLGKRTFQTATIQDVSTEGRALATAKIA